MQASMSPFAIEGTLHKTTVALLGVFVDPRSSIKTTSVPSLKALVCDKYLCRSNVRRSARFVGRVVNRYPPLPFIHVASRHRVINNHQVSVFESENRHHCNLELMGG